VCVCVQYYFIVWKRRRRRRVAYIPRRERETATGGRQRQIEIKRLRAGGGGGVHSSGAVYIMAVRIVFICVCVCIALLVFCGVSAGLLYNIYYYYYYYHMRRMSLVGDDYSTFEPGPAEKFRRRRAEGEENFATDGCGGGARTCSGEGEACCRPSDLGDSEDPSTNLSDATRNAINKR